jgi:hypothetical protein
MSDQHPYEGDTWGELHHLPMAEGIQVRTQGLSD